MPDADHDHASGAGCWLACEGRLLAPLEEARTPLARMRGLLGRDGIDGALLLAPAGPSTRWGCASRSTWPSATAT